MSGGKREVEGKRPTKEEQKMKRRDFLKVSAAGAAATAAVASPAIAQSSPEIKWRMTSSFPKSLDTIYAAVSSGEVRRRDDRQQVPDPGVRAGEIVPGSRHLTQLERHRRDVPHRVVLLCRKDPTWAIYASVPFGLNARQQNSWWYQGGVSSSATSSSRSRT